MSRLSLRSLLLVFAFTGGAVTLGWELGRALAPRAGPVELAARAMDASGIGVGADVLLPRAATRQHPMAVALYATAHATIGDVEDTRLAADELIEAAGANQRPGWGLGFRWDAFGDGSVNPSETVYGITTALAVKALLDAYELVGEPRYLLEARRALDGYASHFTSTPDGGYFWYSEHPADSAPVANVSAMLAGQYARASALVESELYTDLARRAATYLVGHATESESGTVSWPYGINRIGFNDAVHAGYIVEGLLLVEEHLGGLEGFDHDASIGWLRQFIVEPGVVSRFVGGVERDRSWGVGQLLHVFCTYTDDAETIAALLETIEEYEYEPGHYGPHPGVEILYPRFQGHVLLGLASCADRGYL